MKNTEWPKVRARIAIGVLGNDSGVVIEVIQGNCWFSEDVKEFELDEIFYHGAKLPEKAGIYIFNGETRPLNEDEHEHVGVFKPA